MSKKIVKKSNDSEFASESLVFVLRRLVIGTMMMDDNCTLRVVSKVFAKMAKEFDRLAIGYDKRIKKELAKKKTKN